MDTPWFLDVLQLPDSADERSVRHAYATLLRRIDPLADPEDFIRLRTAYDEARRWTAEVASKEVAASGPARDNRDNSEAPEASTAECLASELIERFVTRAQRTPPAALPALLESTLAALRLQYIDAPGMFEHRLVSLLESGAIAHRVMLFDCAAKLFVWDEIGHTRSLGREGAWVDAVLSQRTQWDIHVAPSRKDWNHFLDTAGGATLPERLVRDWSWFAPLAERYPAYLSLYLPPGRIAQWRDRYSPAPGTTPARKAQRQRKLPAWLMRSAAAVMALGLIAFAAGAWLRRETPADAVTTTRCNEVQALLAGPISWRPRAGTPEALALDRDSRACRALPPVHHKETP
ncbi:hypothetical protein FHW69_000728 [Luteibacter sp. Sphag1AF]|uniref:hypothetical protein n=1 Tax=Luteibacter sp. Sphag1AF TaxID=2587031 RepID=UPI001616E18B|nr:hypothetical protein [Luteibacter sp. Sphag1AF]MBB3226138.1 hypothetical protein [Luteibacter sp. Sphag1AF]